MELSKSIWPQEQFLLWVKWEAAQGGFSSRVELDAPLVNGYEVKSVAYFCLILQKVECFYNNCAI